MPSLVSVTKCVFCEKTDTIIPFPQETEHFDQEDHSSAGFECGFERELTTGTSFPSKGPGRLAPAKMGTLCPREI